MSMTYWKGALCVFFLTLVCAFGAKDNPAFAAQSYDSPEAAVKALVEAIKAENKEAVIKILGSGARDSIESGNSEIDSAERAAFVAAYEAKNTLVVDEADKNRRILQIGENNWPFPIPLMSDKQGRWTFDGKAGADEILARHVGRNELSVIEVCRAYVDAQYDYYRLNPDKAVIPHFAQKIVSQPGKRDGLYWETKPGEAESPLGPFVASAADEGRKKGEKQGEAAPYHGYRYRILTSQGKHAPKGAYSYVEKGLMFGGFALIAYPDAYGVSGVMTFMVNQDGVIYEKNLGKNTPAVAQKITSFDPDDTWSKTEAQ